MKLWNWSTIRRCGCIIHFSEADIRNTDKKSQCTTRNTDKKSLCNCFRPEILWLFSIALHVIVLSSSSYLFLQWLLLHNIELHCTALHCIIIIILLVSPVVAKAAMLSVHKYVVCFQVCTHI